MERRENLVGDKEPKKSIDDGSYQHQIKNNIINNKIIMYEIVR